jgi:methionine-S-sulfoxide reductase
VGYAGGTSPAPTYRSLGDHTETIRVEFDPARISYARLLEVFWSAHDPAQRAWSRQYKAVVFFHDKEQERLARETKAAVERRLGRPVFTEILPAGAFHAAEDYHQKYRLRQEPALMREFARMYPAPNDFARSTAAARVNGFLGGEGDQGTLREEIVSYGLSPDGQRALLERAGDAGPGCAATP